MITKRNAGLIILGVFLLYQEIALAIFDYDRVNSSFVRRSSGSDPGDFSPESGPSFPRQNRPQIVPFSVSWRLANPRVGIVLPKVPLLRPRGLPIHQRG